MTEYAKLAILLSIIAASFGAGWTANGWRKDRQISDMHATRSIEIADSANAALADIKAATAVINAAASSAKFINDDLNLQLALIRKDLKNAKPLPVDCRPDSVRVSNLGDTIDTANKAITRPVSSK